LGKTDKTYNLTGMYVDMTFLENETSGDNSIKVVLIEMFMTNFEDFLNSSRKEMKLHNWQNLYKAAHTIKPSVIMFGIREMEPYIQNLLDRCRNEKQLDTVEELLQNCENLYKSVQEEFHVLLKKWK